MEIYNANLNIHYTAPQGIWNNLEQLYKEMPYWNGYDIDGIPNWYGMDEKLITASVEPSGLQFFAKLPKKEWSAWFSNFKIKASKIMGYEVGEPEDGYEFVIY